MPLQKLPLLLLISIFGLFTKIGFTQVNVETVKVKVGNIRKLLRFTGETRPYIESYAAADVIGPVAKILVEDGQKIEKGQTLAIIDPIRYEIALRMAKASLEKAKQQLIEDQREFDRNKILFDKKAITQKTFDLAETALIKSRTNLKQAQADYDKAKLDLERCAIKAPISGYFVDRSIDLGQAMNRGQNMGKVIFLDIIYVEAKIPEHNIREIAIGQKCLIEDKFPGEVEFINLYADNSRAFKVKIKVPNQSLFFKANMFVKGSIILETFENAPLFPSQAIRNDRGEQFVFIVKDGIAKRIPIQIIAQEGELSFAKEIQENMEIIIVGQDNLEDGSKIIQRNSQSSQK